MAYVVYKHTNRANGKAYIGWSSLTMEERWKWHCYDAVTARDSFVFHAAIRKHGSEAWNHEVLEICVSEAAAKLAEIRLITEHKTFRFEHPDKGYNMTRGGDGVSGLTWSAERRKRCSGENAPMFGRRGHLAPAWGKPGTMLGKHHKAVTKQHMREIMTGREITWKQKISEGQPGKRAVQQLRDGVVIATYPSLGTAERTTAIPRSNICKCCRGKLRHAGGFQWQYSGEA
jgi:group I intron endonuclease